MTKKDIAQDNQGENGLNEEPMTVRIIPKKACNAMPQIKEMKVESDGVVNRITYGRDWEEICPHCGQKFVDHEIFTTSFKK